MAAAADKLYLTSLQGLARAGAWVWVTWALAIGFLMVGIWLQNQVYLNHDVAWITHGAGWMLEGRRFGRDIIDVNPPLIWYVSLPAALLVKTGLFNEEQATRSYVWLLCIACAALCHRLLRPMRARGLAPEAGCLFLGAVFAITILPAAGFAQREHLAFVLGLPYCLLIAARLGGDPAPSTRLAIVCGVLGGVAFGFKPWFLAVPLLCEVLHLFMARRLSSVWRAETLALGATITAYLISIALFSPDYLRFAVPLALATYWAYDGTGAPWYYWRIAAAPVVVALIGLAIARQFPPHARVLSAAFVGFSLSFWLQGKGYSYHAYPALASGVCLMALSAAFAVRALANARMSISPWIKKAMAFCMALVALNGLGRSTVPVLDWLDRFDKLEGSEGVVRTLLIDAVNATLPQGGYVYAFSSHPFPAFPTVSYTRAEWGSAFVAQYALPAHLARGRLKDPAKLAALDSAVRMQREQVIDDFERFKPAMVFIEVKSSRLGMRGRRFDDIEFYSQDPRFAEIWRHYREVQPIDSLRVFIRRD